MMASRRYLLFPVVMMMASFPKCDQDSRSKSPCRSPVCAVAAAVQLLDPLAGVAGDLAQLDGVGEDARQYLHAIVCSARLVCVSIAPLPYDGPDFLRPVELRHSQLA